MNDSTHSLVQTLLGLPIFQSEWVLYLLLILSVVSVAVIVERWFFYRKHAVDSAAVRKELSKSLAKGDLSAATAVLQRHDALETNAVLVGLQAYDQGPESVEDLVSGALGTERARYEKRLGFLATIASNAPYIGLFGTVLGIIRSFKDLAVNMSDASASVMAGISEALLATAIGLLVAIPAVIAYNYFKGKVKHAVTECEMLARVLLANLKAAEPASARESSRGAA
jgi:biopolymer transport protein ExbB/TolQ